MHPQTIWKHPKLSQPSLIRDMHETHIHSGTAIAIVTLLACLCLTFSSFFVAEVNVSNDTLNFSIYPKRLKATSNELTYKGVDVMKYTKDLMRNQQSDADIEGIVAAIKNNINPTHIAISIPLDSSQDYPGQAPTPRTAAAFTQKWADTIHSQGMKVIWRGTWSGIEGIYDFQKLDGGDRFPAGTAASALTDGNSTWLGKTYNYIINNPTFFADGDIWAPMPERTEGIFSDSTSFLPHDGSGIQANYASFFNNLKTISDTAFDLINKNVQTGLTANNYTEVASGWLYNSIFETANIVSIDHYGSNHTVEEMESNLRGIYAAKNKPVFLQEWGDYWNQGMEESARAAYLESMYDMFNELATEGMLIGFNYWGGWTGDNEGILTYSNGQWGINSRGLILAGFYDNISAPSPSPAPSPAPVPPPPAPVPVPPPPVPSPTPTPTPSAGGSVTITPTEPAQEKSFTNQYKSGSLINDQGTIYLIIGKTRIPFTNFEAFVKLGYSGMPIIKGNTAEYSTPVTYMIEDGLQQHPWGSWVLHKGTVYYSTADGLIGVPNYEIFVNNGGSFDQLVPANSSDVAVIRQNILQLNDTRVIK